MSDFKTWTLGETVWSYMDGTVPKNGDEEQVQVRLYCEKGSGVEMEQKLHTLCTALQLYVI